jgi:hypothetical protein
MPGKRSRHLRQAEKGVGEKGRSCGFFYTKIFVKFLHKSHLNFFRTESRACSVVNRQLGLPGFEGIVFAFPEKITAHPVRQGDFGE